MMGGISFRSWLAFALEQARFNMDASDPKAAEILQNVLERYDASMKPIAPKLRDKPLGCVAGTASGTAMCSKAGTNGCIYPRCEKGEG